ncbi:MAG TPA: LuxR C-terminal-related transcriptional regulator [Polyangiaceae bacterium]|nr:LuxR C-terminal-related transcriptional regulator [Polyangiaceae bacterium]
MSTIAEPATTSLSQARELYARNAWHDAAEVLLRASEIAPLPDEDLWRLAWACGLRGRDSEMLLALESIFHRHAEGGNPLSAARAAFWLGFRLLGMGELSSGNGWLARAERLVERAACECAEQGYLLLPEIRRQFAAGNYALAYDAALRAEGLGERFADADLQVFARNFQGRVLLRQGALEAGLKLLDEVMLSVTKGELSPSVCGLIYCSAIDACQSVFALDRARQWTEALSRWCAALPQLITFTGACMVSRAEILQVGGQWLEALAESERATERYLATLGVSATGDARYRHAEIQRLRGELAAAEVSYREAGQWGRDPQPGLALLRLAQGRADTALHAIRRAEGDAREPFRRANLLPALVQILLANGALEEARIASSELDGLGGKFGSELLQSVALHARGSVELAEGKAAAAAATLRRAFQGLQQVGAPYLAAQARVALACACQALGDEDGAMLESQAARVTFHSLGAMLDLVQVDKLSLRAEATVAPNAGGLTARELGVLRLVALGKTNKLIARELCLSEKTVDRHLSNILAKLAVPSRAAATAYAYEHDLL